MIERKFVSEGILNVKISDFLEKRLSRANIVNVEVQKTALVSRITIEAEKPGLIIGKKGSSIQSLTQDIEKEFGIEQPQIEVKPLTEKPELNATVMAKRIARQVEQGLSAKVIIKKTIYQAMNAGAQGIEVVIQGALAGKGGQSQKHSEIAGYVKKVGDLRRLVGYGKEIAKTKKGVVGIHVRLVQPNVQFIDKEDIRSLLPSQKLEDVAEKKESPENGKKDVAPKEETKTTETEKGEEAKESEPAKEKATKETSDEKKPEAKEAAKPGKKAVKEKPAAKKAEKETTKEEAKEKKTAKTTKKKKETAKEDEPAKKATAKKTAKKKEE